MHRYIFLFKAMSKISLLHSACTEVCTLEKKKKKTKQKKTDHRDISLFYLFQNINKSSCMCFYAFITYLMMYK